VFATLQATSLRPGERRRPGYVPDGIMGNLWLAFIAGLEHSKIGLEHFLFGAN